MCYDCDLFENKSSCLNASYHVVFVTTVGPETKWRKLACCLWFQDWRSRNLIKLEVIRPFFKGMNSLFDDRNEVA